MINDRFALNKVKQFFFLTTDGTSAKLIHVSLIPYDFKFLLTNCILSNSLDPHQGRLREGPVLRLPRPRPRQLPRPHRQLQDPPGAHQGLRVWERRGCNPG